MRVVKLKLQKPGHYWKLGSLVLNPDSPETKSFDLDVIDERMRRGIIRASEVFGVFSIEHCDGLPEMTVKLPIDAASPQEPNIQSVTVVEDKPPQQPVVKELVIADQDRINCRLLLEKTVTTIKKVVAEYPQTAESRGMILGLIQEERKGKGRKTLLKSLEASFLAIPPQGE